MIKNAVTKIMNSILPISAGMEEKTIPSKFPCKRCGGTGMLFFTKDNVPYATRCPDCLEARAQAQRLKESGIALEDYQTYTLDNFQTDTEIAVRMKRMAITYLNDKAAKGLGCFGMPGTGKTHLCIAICQAMKQEHHYWQYRHEIQKIKLAMYKDWDKYDAMMRKACSVPYLYIDDLYKGAVINGQLSPQDIQIMFEIINGRYIKRLPTLFSSEYTTEQIIALDEGTGSRIKSMVTPYWINITDAKNRRLK